jgi:hypothetical protein
VTVVSWSEMAQRAPELAGFGQERLDGKVAYLATLRGSGGPRAHPVTPIIGAGKCFVFIEPTSAKSRDLRANGQFCLHCAMSDSSGSSGEFQLSGQAREVSDADVRSAAEAVSNYKPSGRYLLFELKISEAISTAYRGGRPDRKKWAC